MIFKQVIQQQPFLRSSFLSKTRMVHTEKVIQELGYVLPACGQPKGNYCLTTRSGNTLYVAGHLPQPANGDLLVGKVGKDFTVDEGYHAAHLAALNMISTLKAELGDLDRVKRIVKLVGFVNCVDGFGDQPKVINGASDTFGAVFGGRGVHARSAVGTNALPLNIPVEIEAVIEISD